MPDDGKRCSIGHCQQPLDANPLSAPAHARQHKREFEQTVGRKPHVYAEVRALFNDGEVPDDCEFEDFEITQLTDFEETTT